MAVPCSSSAVPGAFRRCRVQTQHLSTCPPEDCLNCSTSTPSFVAGSVTTCTSSFRAGSKNSCGATGTVEQVEGSEGAIRAKRSGKLRRMSTGHSSTSSTQCSRDARGSTTAARTTYCDSNLNTSEPQASLYFKPARGGRRSRRPGWFAAVDAGVAANLATNPRPGPTHKHDPWPAGSNSGSSSSSSPPL